MINNVELTFPNLRGRIINVRGRMNRKSSGLNCRVFLFSKAWWECFFHGFLAQKAAFYKRSVWASILFNQNARNGKRAVPDFTVHTYIFRGKQFADLMSVDVQLFTDSGDTHPSKPIGLAGGITALKLASKASMLSFTSCKWSKPKYIHLSVLKSDLEQ